MQAFASFINILESIKLIEFWNIYNIIEFWNIFSRGTSREVLYVRLICNKLINSYRTFSSCPGRPHRFQGPLLMKWRLLSWMSQLLELGHTFYLSLRRVNQRNAAGSRHPQKSARILRLALKLDHCSGVRAFLYYSLHSSPVSWFVCVVAWLLPHVQWVHCTGVRKQGTRNETYLGQKYPNVTSSTCIARECFHKALHK